ncbi:site-specific integrase [Streptomyces sp. ISL-22]|nr:site-specific integrase [Streptomyces sp. ISL-24]MBT2432236.1 site-specific integrase [Streptomyces sp. ISL-22]
MATVYQRCKTDKRNKHYPCEKTRCGHEWTVRYREPGGRTARQREESFLKKTLADQFAAKVEHDKDQGVYLDPKRGEITVRAYAKDWLERQVIGESTYGNYESFIRIHLVPHLGRKTIAGVQPKDIERFVAAISKKLAASTVYDRMKMVTGMFKTAVKEKRISGDPTEDVKIPRVSADAVDEDEIPTLDEVELIAKHISPQYRLTVYLQAGAGLRISETLAFATECRRGDFIRVRWQVSSKANRKDCKTRFVPLKHRAEGEYRDIPIPVFLGEEIDAHMAEWGAVPAGDLEVLFAPRERGKGTMPTATTYAYHFKKALKDAGLVKLDGTPKYTPHGLRHYFASTALANGIPIHEVSHWLGHKSIKTTVDIYGHLVPAAWDRCRDIMQRAMRPQPVDVATAAPATADGYDAAA